jgi:hypothetical protein
VIIEALYCIFLLDNWQSFLIALEADIRYHSRLYLYLPLVSDESC